MRRDKNPLIWMQQTMSRFYASIQGNRGEATRQGSEKGGIEGHIRGWDVGVHVALYVNDHGQDEISIHFTGGSTNSSSLKMLGKFKRVGDEIEEVK